MVDITRFAVRRFGAASLVGICLLLAAPTQAAPITFGDIEITQEPTPKGNSSHGYFEYAFEVANKSAQQTHIVTLTIPFERLYAPGDSIRELRRTVQVGAQEKVRVSLLQPPYPPLDGRDVAVIIDGRRHEREIPLPLNESTRRYFYSTRRYPSYSAPIEPLVLLGPHVKPLPTTVPGLGAVSTGMRAGMWPGLAPGFSGVSPGMVVPRPATAPEIVPRLSEDMWKDLLLPPLGWNGLPHLDGTLIRLMLAWQRGEIEPPSKPGVPPDIQFVKAEMWSSDWLAYTRYDGIVVTAAELNALPEAVRTALWQYVETGGSLLILGPTDLRGLSAMREMTTDKAGWLNGVVGFGICRISPDANYESWDADRFQLVTESWKPTAAAWSGGRVSVSDPNQEFPIIDDLGIPIKGLFTLMFLFVLGIGPINILVLSRLKRRIWLLWTTPVLSLCTCLAVFGYMLISEGWSGRLRSETLTLLDETTHRATTIGLTGVYSPLTPGDGLHFRYETEVIPHPYYERLGRGGHSRILDWSQDQHFAAGWVEARVPAHFLVRKSELRRERIVLYRERDNRWGLVNGLGASLRRFWYVDAKGQIHTAQDIAPGARAILRPTEKESIASFPAQRIVFTSNWLTMMKALTDNPERYLHPGQYLAEMDESPFLEDALRNARTRRLHALVLGLGHPEQQAPGSKGDKP